MQQCFIERQTFPLADLDVAGRASARDLATPRAGRLLLGGWEHWQAVYRSCSTHAHFLAFQFEGACVQQRFCEGQILLLAALGGGVSLPTLKVAVGMLTSHYSWASLSLSEFSFVKAFGTAGIPACRF